MQCLPHLITAQISINISHSVSGCFWDIEVCWPIIHAPNSFLKSHHLPLTSHPLTTMSKTQVLRLLFGSYILAIILLVTLPLNAAQELNNITIIKLRGDYFFHILLFLPWMIFVKGFRWSSFLWLLSGICFAGASEFVQYFLTYRAFNINDLIANVSGVMVGSALFWIFRKIY